MYRDRTAHSEARIAYLEERVKEQAEENLALREQIDKRNQAVIEVVHATHKKLDARWRTAGVVAALLGVSAAVMAAGIAYAAWSGPIGVEIVQLPAPSNHFAGALDYPKFERQSGKYLDEVLDKGTLYGKLKSGTATTRELQTLRWICLRQDESFCRQAAERELKKRRR